jgi:ankyrin repeat protein
MLISQLKGATILHVAAQKGFTAIIESILDAGLDIEIANKVNYVC